MAALAIATAGLCHAQTPAKLRFEVASIKPSPTPPGIRYLIDDHRIDFGAIPLSGVVGIAFDVPSWRLTIPEWTRTAGFDILASLPKGATKDQVPQMLQTLLAERFGLVIHHETKEQQVVALIQGKGGAKLADAAADNNDRTFVTGRATLFRFSTPEDNGSWTISAKDGRSVLDAQRITMSELAGLLTARRFFDDPVIDMTGLRGYWQVRFDVPKNNGAMRANLAAQGVQLPPEDPEGVSLEGSLRKLGLDLEHRKAPVDYLVVDHLERQPTEN
jgi:uncharacterized protein (TIGR03435 family)